MRQALSMRGQHLRGLPIFTSVVAAAAMVAFAAGSVAGAKNVHYAGVRASGSVSEGIRARKSHSPREHYQLSTIYNFGNGKDGGSPAGAAPLLDAIGALYIAAESGGTTNNGAVVKLTPSGSSYAESVLNSFHGHIGAFPFGGLIADTSGALYGTTTFGGTGNRGLVYKITPSGSSYSETVLYRFGKYPDGSYPQGALLSDGTGALYGTTLGGGKYQRGTVFKLTPSGSGYAESIVYDFRGGSDGAKPYSDLSTDASGAFYGMTELGGNKNHGVVFKLTPSGSGYTESILHRFAGFPEDGAYPVQSRLIPDGTGAFYGITSLGGARGFGAVFKVTPSRTGYSETVVHSFRGHPDDGSVPASLLLAHDAKFYGTTALGGLSNAGTIFELAPTGSGYIARVLYSFQNKLDGTSPIGLTVDSTGSLYGVTGAGGLCAPCGTVFKLTPSRDRS
jgi:uncharacterized repeat protein (TIGR03803 family)